MHVKANDSSLETSSGNSEIGIIPEPREFKSKMPSFSEPEHYLVLLFKIKKNALSQMHWNMPGTPTPRRLREEDLTFEISWVS